MFATPRTEALVFKLHFSLSPYVFLVVLVVVIALSGLFF
jgi:hypothetical protein